MFSRSRFLAPFLFAAALLLSAPARAQCPDWMTGFGLPGTTGVLRAITSFGGDIYAAGDVVSAGGVPASWVARWNGAAWQNIGAGINGTVYALAVFDDGGGPALHAGGSFTTAGVAGTQGIAKWNGASWSSLAGGTNGSVRALAVFDKGSGAALYAGGSFSQAGGAPAANIASWDGASWSTLGSGTNAQVQALVALITPSARELYVGGSFLLAGGAVVNRIAKWDGTSWSALGSGMDGEVHSLALYDDGSGRKVHAGGVFFNAGGVPALHVARWDGANWSPLDCGIDNDVRTLLAYDDGSGTQLYAGGNFNVACGAATPRFVRWDGTHWNVPPGGTLSSHVNALATHYDAAQGRTVLIVGGAFLTAGNPALYLGTIASWNGANWSAIGGQGLKGYVHALRVFTPSTSSTPLLYVGGSWNFGFPPYPFLRAWNGNAWVGEWGANYGSPTPRINAMCEHDDGTGRQLYVAGYFDKTIGATSTARNIARFDGQNFTQLGPPTGTVGLGEEIFTLAIFDSGQGPVLYAGGKNAAYNRIAKWNGTSWSDVGGGVVGFYGYSDGFVSALQTFDDGSGPALYVGGNFATTGAGPIAGVARWDGSNWSQLGGGLDGSGPYSSVIYSMTVFDDGTGAALYLGGSFHFNGNPALVELAKWDGSTWAAIPGNPLGPIYALQVLDDNSGLGPVLEAGGYYGFARWDGANWSAPGGGANDVVNALTAWDQSGDGSLDLVAGGEFTAIGGVQSSAFAIRLSCGGPGTPFCAGDGSLPTPCPCGNEGLAGRGCENSSSTGGALLEASGTVNPDTVVLTSSFERATALSIFLQGNAQVVGGTGFGDGLRCVGGSLKRIASSNAFGGVASYPHPNDASITQRSALLGDPIAPGSTRYYQTYYRDPSPGFCAAPAGSTWNVSSGMVVVW